MIIIGIYYTECDSKDNNIRLEFGMNKGIFLLAILCTHLCFPLTTTQTTQLDDATTLVKLNLDLDANEYAYKDYIDFSVDNPDVELVGWESTTEPESVYDVTFKENKKVYKNKLAFNVKVKTSASAQEANLHFSYYRTRDKAITQEIIPLAFNSPQPAPAYAIDAQAADIVERQPATSATTTPQHIPATKSSSTWSDSLANWAKKSDSLWLRLLLVFLLGILMSLTPCIYPMIPITIGVLQAQGQPSFIRNFLLALSYVAGIATTFAMLGVFAAFTGQLFGTIMSNPITILIIVALLIYLAGSMLGLYEMYIPRTLTASNSALNHGSYLSAFIFGAISGSVASPCLSPGLVLLLSLVTTLGSKLIGFALLFSFGLGLGLPLLIIGTFSNSLQLLPRAGMWMVEVKRLFGFIMLGMCFYFLSTLVPLCTLLWALMVFVFGVGIFYIYDAQRTSNARTLKTVLGIALVAAAVVIGAYAYKATCMIEDATTAYLWQDDYDKALQQAQQEHKKIFIYFGASFCSICTAIDNTVFKNPVVCSALTHVAIPVKIDCSEGQNTVCSTLKKEFNVFGFPTYLLVDPANGTLIKQWGSELYTMKHDDFAAELEKYAV